MLIIRPIQAALLANMDNQSPLKRMRLDDTAAMASATQNILCQPVDASNNSIPPLNIERTSIKKLQQLSTSIQTEIDEFIRIKNGHIQQIQERIEYLKSLTERERKQMCRPVCSTEECTNFALQGGKCARHGAKLKRCTVAGCDKKSQRKGLCARHGAGATQPKCTVEGCDKVSRKNRLCFVHGPKEICNFEGGCTNLAEYRGVCQKHRPKRQCVFEGCMNEFARGWKGLCAVHAPKKKPKPKCSYEGGCDNIAQTRGMCHTHAGTRPKCKVEGCTNNAVRESLCNRHCKPINEQKILDAELTGRTISQLKEFYS